MTMLTWREVEMPPQVEDLPRSGGGLPVPYVASWAGEEEMRIAACPFSEGRLAVFPAADVVGETKPVFGVMEAARQREVVLTARCQVCRVDLGPVWPTVESRSSVHWLVELAHKPATYGRPLILEPWVCGACLAYALRVCPGLAKMRPNGHGVRLLAVFAAQPVASIVRPTGNLAGDPIAHRGVVGYVKIEPLAFHRIASELFLEYGFEQLEEWLNADPPRVLA